MPQQGSVSPRSAGGEDRAKTTAKWGAACASCAAAKAKCIRSDEEPGSKCDRCERLFKDCTDQIHRPRKKRASKPSKTAQLEERLNGLVDLLKATGELPSNVNVVVPVTGSGSLALRPESTSTTSPFNPPSAPSAARDGSGTSGRTSAAHSPSETRDTRELRDLRRDTAPHAPPPVIPSTYNSFAPPACICRPEAGATVTDAVESDETLLAKYRDEMGPRLPIIVLPANITAAQLAADRPFLFLAIKTVASVDNYRSMQGLMYQLINHVADYMLLRAERSQDLLQGLLTILSWYHHHCLMHAQLGNLLHLAASLVSDLGLTRPARLAERTDLMVLHPNPPSPRTHAERRLLLGLWYIRSCVALCFQKVEPMRFSPYMRQCLQELEDAHDAESDATLVALVRLQILSEKIGSFNSREESVDEIPYFPRAPKAAYKIAFQSELDQLVASMSEPMRKQYLIEMHISSVKLRLYEPPLLDLVLLRKLSASLTSSASPMMATALDMLYSARSALLGFFEQFFTVPTQLYHFMPISMNVNLIYGITMLSRWARLIGPTRPAQQPNVRGPALNKAGTESTSSTKASDSATASAAATAASGSASSATTASASSTDTNNTSTAPTISSLDLKDPSHRLVPGQGVGATIGAGAGATSIPFTFIPGMDARELQRDPSLLTAVFKLREHMRQQPDLQLDIPATLATMWDKFEKSNRDMRAAGAIKFGDSVGRGMNVWDLTARKIAIMRFKVGRYLDGATAVADPSGSGGGGAGGGGSSGSGSGSGNDSRDMSQQAQMRARHSSQDQTQHQRQHHQQQQQHSQQHPQAQQTSYQPYLPYARQLNMGQQQDPKFMGLNMASPHPQQQLPYSAQNQMPTFASGATGSPASANSNNNNGGTAGTPGVGMPPGMVPPQINGLPPDLGSYVMGSQGVAAADLSYGLGNLEGWDSDPLWGADLFGTGTDPAMWADNMDWVATLG
ncbi:hypothetical protein SBRCBS47491_007440 [Sporothrix bragantina]|uniref:Zn(2)-C6 fungal-type domain-containing protein n=1 Tax=Sporothrix bragantina TaxID=671064 RepID=A0ABP0CD66_9PEZI